MLAEALTVAEDKFYADFDHLLAGTSGALAKLWTCIDLAASGGPAIGDWVLWMEVWVQALRDDQVRATREQLDRRWRRTLLDVIQQGLLRACSVAPTRLRRELPAGLADGRPGRSARAARPGPDHRPHDRAVARGGRA